MLVLYGSECWATKSLDGKRSHLAEVKQILIFLCGVTHIKNDMSVSSFKVTSVEKKI